MYFLLSKFTKIKIFFSKIFELKISNITKNNIKKNIQKLLKFIIFITLKII